MAITWKKVALADSVVPTTLTISTTAPLTGGGDLSANRTFAIPAATASVNGYMTSIYAGKLDGIASSAQVNVLESVTGTTPIVAGAITAKSQAISISAATTSAAGSMSAADKTKLDSLTAGAYVLKAGDTMTGALTNTLASGNSLVWDTSTLIVDASNHRVGIGTTEPVSLLDVKSGVNIGPSLTYTNAAYLGLQTGATDRLVFGQDNNAPYGWWMQTKNNSNAAMPLSINPLGGYVGIATTAPINMFHVVSTRTAGFPATSGGTQTGDVTRLQGLSTVAVLDTGYGGNGIWWLQSTENNSLGTYHDIVLNPKGGYVGIGTTNPEFGLDISNTAQIYNNSSYSYLYMGGTVANAGATSARRSIVRKNYASPYNLDIISSASISGSLTPINFYVGDRAGDVAMTITSSKYVGIGITNPERYLVVAGSTPYIGLNDTDITWNTDQLTAYSIKQNEIGCVGVVGSNGGLYLKGVNSTSNAPTILSTYIDSFVEGDPTTYAATYINTYKRNAGVLTAVGDSGAILKVANNLITKFTILGSGNVGVNTMAPLGQFTLSSEIAQDNVKFDIVAGGTSGDAVIRFGGNSGGVADYVIGDIPWGVGVRRNSNVFTIAYNVAGSENLEAGQVFSIDASGKVGVATTLPNSTLHVAGSFALPISAVKTSAYTVTALDHTILCNASGGAFTVTLPTAVGIAGRIYTFKHVGTSAQPATIDGYGSETIDGSTTKSVGSYAYWSIQSDGSNWHVISG